MSIQLTHKPNLNPISQIQRSMINLEQAPMMSMNRNYPKEKFRNSRSVSKFVMIPAIDPVVINSPVYYKKCHPAFNVGSSTERKEVNY